MNNKVVIDTTSCSQSPKLNARKVWQVLFNIYRENGGDLNNMDSLLCDLYILTQWFENKNWYKPNNQTDLWWRFNGYFTDTTEFAYPDSWHIYQPNQFTIVIEKEKQ